MADFLPAFQFMAPHEWNGAVNYTDTPGDPGGPTKYGITLATLRKTGTLYDLDGDGLITSTDVKLLTLDEAEHFYLCQFWEVEAFPSLNNQRVASKVFDMAVNLGPPRAVIYLQDVANRFKPHALLPDGRLGPKTAGLVNGLDPDQLLNGLVVELVAHYAAWISDNPTQRERFGPDLMGRAKALPA